MYEALGLGAIGSSAVFAWYYGKLVNQIGFVTLPPHMAWMLLKMCTIGGGFLANVGELIELYPFMFQGKDLEDFDLISMTTDLAAGLAAGAVVGFVLTSVVTNRNS